MSVSRAILAGAEVVAKLEGVSVEAIMGPGRHAPEVRARQMLWLALRHELPHLSFPAIGQRFGRDHTTVLYGAERAQHRVATEPEAFGQLAAIRLAILLARPSASTSAVEAVARALDDEIDRVSAQLEELRSRRRALNWQKRCDPVPDAQLVRLL
jgi:ATPase involved in DNA replication initiation